MRHDQVAEVLERAADGETVAQTARALALPPGRVRWWRQRFAGVAQLEEAVGLKPIQCGFESLHQHQCAPYAYLLGMYLGDGYIATMSRSYVLRVSLNRRQADVARRVAAAISIVMPGRRVGFVMTQPSVTIVTCYSNDWPAVFPQHGRGRKHRRRIVLQAWQEQVVREHPGEFVRGLIESDGCRHRRVVGGTNYPAYSFSHRSEDILRLFGAACDGLGVRWRRSNRVTISIARRPDVARLDAMFAVTADWAPQAVPPPTGRGASLLT